MTDNHMLHPMQTIETACRREVSGQAAWLLLPLAQPGAELRLSGAWGKAQWQLPPGWQGLLLLEHVRVTVVSGCLSFHAVQLETLAKLLAFIDEARALPTVNPDARCERLFLEDLSIWSDRRRLEYWFLGQLLSREQTVAPLLAQLRRNESYWLVRFLLSHSARGDKLQALGDRYGVSTSHFRRLCRHALGNAAKASLRDWRAARCMLDVVGGEENLTRLALKHGYASPAHFSNEVKGLLGVSPRGLSNLIQLAVK
ncbi:helix-turn-helix domain-containing protein [Chromobacterium sp. IIBBL 290-4]|uniref:helix-turn-helix domain-containing protein n=1 Tax=Chromobacterium sp. IIBBL 290-4 TaxID=2953890 RepID=UPI0020B7B76A|nr:helix-turn-helix domain-containing protein [Chromobacterium sp. IIBBL 290-4]UTH74108.1 helix-turn-helix domain-containing protein [Chromobacterium sp. IIBBL 290-4]